MDELLTKLQTQPEHTSSRSKRKISIHQVTQKPNYLTKKSERSVAHIFRSQSIGDSQTIKLGLIF